MSEARNADEAIRLALETAAAYRLSDPHDREVLKRFVLCALRRVKADGSINSEDAYKLLQAVDLGTFRELEAECYLGLVSDNAGIEAYELL